MHPNKLCYILLLTILLLVSLKIGSDIYKSLKNIAIKNATSKANMKIKKQVKFYSMKQNVDHFNKTDNRTWLMSYSRNEEFFEANGPMFIAIHGAGPKIDVKLQKGMMIYDLAKEHKGFMFSLEHRFYGKHWPLPTLRTENLAYLTIKQALADLAKFIRYQKSTVNGLRKSRVILIGCGNGGTLALWFQKIYPSLVHGTWASGAALHAKLNFHKQLESSGELINQFGSSRCYQSISEFFQRLRSLMAEKGANVLRGILNLCNNFNDLDKMDVSMFYKIVIEIIENTLKSQKTNAIEKLCRKVLKEPHKFSTLWHFLINQTEPYVDQLSRCHDLSYENYIKTLSKIDDKKNYERQWLYQKCNEYGFFKTTNSRDHPFGNTLPLNFSILTCANVFGEKYTPEFIVNGLRATNKQFYDFAKPLHNAYMTYGEYDPWQYLSIPEEKNVRVIKDAFQCEDLGSISLADTPYMLASKHTLLKLVRQWLR